MPWSSRTCCAEGAKAGTTHFHAYATAFVLQASKRVTLALSFIYAEESLANIVADLLGRHRQGWQHVGQV